jgi:Sulfatase
MSISRKVYVTDRIFDCRGNIGSLLLVVERFNCSEFNSSTGFIVRSIHLSKNVIVITVEGLSTSLVGAYGSSIAETPTLNGMAAGGIVLDQCFLDSRQTDEMLASLWTGQHALTRLLRHSDSNREPKADKFEIESGSTIWQAMQAASGAAVLVTDCPLAADLAERFGCERVELVEPGAATNPADEVMQCSILALFSTAAEVIEEMREEHCPQRLCWIHTKGLRLPWDAPVELRNSFKDADDPDPPASVGPPQLQVTNETDPDIVVGWSQVAAAQVAVLDQAIALLQTIVGDEWSWCVLGIDGCPLGEHGWVGCGQTSFHDEQLQTAAIISPRPAPLIGWRVAEICQLPDLAATIADLCGLTMSNVWGGTQLGAPEDASPMQWDAKHQLAVLVEEDKVWIRTPAWSCTSASIQSEQLYVKPDDRWEASEVSNRCQDVIDELKFLADRFIAAAKINRRADLVQLSELLCNLHR